MKEIKLKNYGKFFSGRSRAVDIVNSVIQSKVRSVQIDFESIGFFSQSFISELFVALIKKGIDPDRTTYVNLSNDLLQERFKKEQARLKEFPPSA